MTTILRQSTQIVVRVGPFVDVGDGFTPETSIDLGTADEAELLKAAGAATVSIAAATWAAISGADGWYDLTLTTSHTDTVGELIVVVQDDSICLPVFMTFQVIEEAIYDALFAASATGALPVSSGGITTASFAAGAIDAAAIAANAIGSSEIADGAITAAKIATDAIDADALAADALAEINAQVVDALATDTYAEPTGVPGATVSLASKLGYIYMALRNKVTVTASKKTFFDDGDAAEWEKDLSDDGTTYTETEGNSV